MGPAAPRSAALFFVAALGAAAPGSSGVEVDGPPASRLATLWANDPLSSSADLSTGHPGSEEQGFQRVNSNSDVTYGVYNKGNLTSGVQGDETAAWLDLGPEAGISPACQTVGSGQAFASAHFADPGSIAIVSACGSSNGCPQTFAPLPAAQQKQLAALRSGATARPIAGHMLLLRIASGGRDRAWFKLLVVDATASAVTVRYAALDPSARLTTCCDGATNICRGSHARSANTPAPAPPTPPRPAARHLSVLKLLSPAAWITVGVALAALFAGLIVAQRRLTVRWLSRGPVHEPLVVPQKSSEQA